MTDWFKAIDPLPGDGIVTAAVTTVARIDAMLEIPDFLRRASDGSFLHPDVPPPAYSPPGDYIFAPWPSDATQTNLTERDLEIIEQLRYHADTSERIATQERIAKLKAKKEAPR